MYSCNVPGHQTGSREPWTVIGQVGSTRTGMSGNDACATKWFGVANPETVTAGGMAPGARAGMRLQVPTAAGYSISQVKSWMYADTVNTGSPATVLVQMNGSDYPLWTSPVTIDRTAAPSPWIQSVTAGTTDFWWQLRCDGINGQNCGIYSANPLELLGAEVTVSESGLPGATIDGGTLVSAGAKRATKTVTVTGTDALSGVQKLEVLLDDMVMGTIDYSRDWSQELSAQKVGTCRFDDWHACPTSQPHEFAVNTTTVPDGAYALSVRTTDAAGNVKTTTGPDPVTVDNTAPAAPAATSPLDVSTEAASTNLTWSHPNGQLSPIVAAHVVVTGPSGRTQDLVVPVGGNAGGATLNRFDGFGLYTARVGLEDEAGNYDPAQARTYRVTFAQTPAPAPAPVSADPVTPLLGPAGPRGDAGAPGAPGAAGASGTAGAAGAAGAATVLHLNGSNATAAATIKATFVGSNTGVIRSPYGKRVLITGRLVAPGGKPIVGAKVTVLQQDKMVGARMIPAAEVVTDAAGRFRYVTTAVRSRTIRFAYRAHLEDLSFAQTTDISLGVIAKISLTTNRRSLRNGQSVVFRGTVAGAPHNARKVVELQVRKGSSWMTFRTTRLRNGRFSERYRFRRTRGRVTYTFRARVRQEAGFPFLTGHSGTAKVTVRG
jgi:hypothetical protein